MKKAVHFGAGNIGRGFIGVILDQSGYQISFVDTDKELISQINKQSMYKVVEVGADSKEYVVDDVVGVEAGDKEQVVAEISQADLITTAVGVDNLKFLVSALVEGIKRRHNSSIEKKLNIIACENAVQASSQLKKEVKSKLEPKILDYMEQYIGFPDAAVDRIIPPQTSEQLEVKVEPFSEWIIDKTQFRGPNPNLEGVELTDNLLAYVERKIFTLNTGHCGTAYLGYLKGYEYIHQAIQDKEIADIIKKALLESGRYLIDYYGFDEEKHKEYIEKILTRFENEALQDSVVRVGREPLRKLSAEDRLVKPALRSLEVEYFPEALSICIAAGLLFDPSGDEQAKKLQVMIDKSGLEKALEEVTSRSADNKLGQEIIGKYDFLKEDIKLD